MSTKHESVSNAAFRAWPFLSGFNFAFKDGRVTASTYKYYRPLVVSRTITNCCKRFHLKYGRVPKSVIENAATHGTWSGFVGKQVFFLIISKCCHLYQKSLRFSVLLFTI